MRLAAPLRVLPVAVGHGAGALRARVGGVPARWRRRMLFVLALLALLAGVYFAWFRDSSIVAVQKVTVTGITTSDAPRIRARLIAAAESMTTLHVDKQALMDALPTTAAVADLRITTSFPHGMAIQVIQSSAVAVLVAPGRRIAVAADGSLLTGVRAGSVPAINVGALPSSGRLGRGRALTLVAAAAAAPAPLRSRIARIRQLPVKGLVAYIEAGPQVILGDSTRLAAKWAVAAAVLADPDSRGASYVDVSLPERPVAGGVSVPQPDPAQQGQPPAAALGTGTPGAGGPGTGAAATGTPGAGAQSPPGATASGTAGTPGTGTPGTGTPGTGTPGTGTPGAGYPGGAGTGTSP
jgi:cell division protein FtsQ